MSTWLPVILALLCGNFALELIAETLNLRAAAPCVPAEFADTFDSDRYRRSQEYLGATTRFGLLREMVGLLLLLGFLFLGGFDALDRFARGFGLGTIATGLVFFGALSLLRMALGLPFSAYSTFVIEEGFGFNRTSPLTFVLDLLKATVLGAILGVPILGAVLWVFDRLGADAWWLAWIATTIFSLVVGFLAPALILPLFNRYEPLPPGPLRDGIEAYARSQNVRLSGIYTMDGSKRSTKTNAFFTGFGRFRKLVLFDTLVAKHPVDELVAVLAHEVGHFRLRHIPKSLALSAASSLVAFFALSKLLWNRELFDAFRVQELSTYASLVFAGILFAPVSRALSFLAAALSRRFEFQADAFSARTFGRPESLVSALKRLSADNLSNLTPHPFKVALDYSHPPVLERIRALRRGSSQYIH